MITYSKAGQHVQTMIRRKEETEDSLIEIIDILSALGFYDLDSVDLEDIEEELIN